MLIINKLPKIKIPRLKQQGTFKKKKTEFIKLQKSTINSFKVFFQVLTPALAFHFLAPGTWKAFFQSG